MVLNTRKNDSNADGWGLESPSSSHRLDCLIVLKPFHRPIFVVRLKGLLSVLEPSDLLAWFQQVATAINNQLKRLTLEKELQARVQEKTKALEEQIEETEKAIGARSRF